MTPTNQECGATRPMPDDILAVPHDCKSEETNDDDAYRRFWRRLLGLEPMPPVHTDGSTE